MDKKENTVNNFRLSHLFIARLLESGGTGLRVADNSKKDKEEGIQKTNERKMKVDEGETNLPESQTKEKPEETVNKETQIDQLVAKYKKDGNYLKLLFVIAKLAFLNEEIPATEIGRLNDRLLARTSGRLRPIIIFIIVPSLGLLLSNLVSFFEFTDSNSLLVIGITALVSFVLYSSYLGPFLQAFRPFGFMPFSLFTTIKNRNVVWKDYASKYFKKVGEENAIIEIETIKKIIYVAIPVLGILVSIYSFDLWNHESLKQVKGYVENYFKPILGDNFFLRATILSVIYVMFLLVFMLEFLITKEFRYYYAQACIAVMSNQVDVIKQIRYLILGLNSYNKYLAKNLNLRFDDIKVYSGILGANNRDTTIKKITTSFTSADRLQPIATLCESLQDKQDFFVKQRIGQKVKDWAALLAGIIPVVITLLRLIYPHSIPG